jgi:hypothetical protein
VVTITIITTALKILRPALRASPICAKISRLAARDHRDPDRSLLP